jgi:hypothetical protein
MNGNNMSLAFLACRFRRINRKDYNLAQTEAVEQTFHRAEHGDVCVGQIDFPPNQA